MNRNGTECCRALTTVLVMQTFLWIYTAVSDPSGAGLVNEDGNNVEISMVLRQLPVTEQMALIRELMPDAKKIGILYTTSEANSVSTIQEYKDHAE